MDTNDIRRWVLVGITVGAAALTGCAMQPMRLALTEMGTSSDSEYGVTSQRLQRAVTITGLGAEETVGTISSDSDMFSIVEQLKRFWPARSDLPDSMSPRLATGEASEIHVRSFGSDADIGDLMALRDLLQVAQQQLSLAAQEQLKVAVLSNARKTLPDKAAATDALPATMVSSLGSLYPDRSWKTIQDLDAAIAAGAAVKQVDAKGGVLDQVRAVMKKRGVIVTQWQGDTSVTAHVDSSVGNVGLDGNRSVGGYLILGAPQVHTLYLGNDIKKLVLCPKADKGTPPCMRDAFKPRRQYLTIYQLRARHVIYAEASRSSTRAGVRLKLDELAKAASAAGYGLNLQTIEALKLDVEAGYAALQAAGTSGVLDAGDLVPPATAPAGSPSSLDVYALTDLGPTGRMAPLLKASIPVVNMRMALKEKLAEIYGE